MAKARIYGKDGELTEEVAPVNPHQDAINNLVIRVLPRVRALPFAANVKEPWLGNVTVDKAVLATIETIFALADEDAKAASISIESEAESEVLTMSEPSIPPQQAVIDLPEIDQS